MRDDPIESPSRKRLLADPKPKQCSSAPAVKAPSDFPNRKKTRDLPNLSDCHSCGLHINATNPNDKLQPLPSVWRIVLLCKKCLNRVELAKLCSYCFSVADSDCYRCRDCNRHVHKDCIVRYKCSAPWSYCCSELGSFSVCVDCWMPKSLGKSIMVYKRRRINKVLENSGNCGGLEAVVNDAKKAVEKKSRLAVKAKENALRKAVVAKRATELAHGALELVANKDDRECSVTCSSSGSETTAATTCVNVELAFKLHRAINSSPRTSGNPCLMNSCSLPLQRLGKDGGSLSVRLSSSKGIHNASVSGKMEECCSQKLTEDTDASMCSKGIPSPSPSGKIGPSHKANATTDVSQPKFKVYVRRSDSARCTSSCDLKQGILVYTRRCKKDKGHPKKGGMVVGNHNNCDDSSLIFESQTCHKQDELEYEPHLYKASNPNQQHCDGNGNMLNVERSTGKPDRYLLKYSKRPREELKYELHPDDTRNQNRVNCNGNDTIPLDKNCNGKQDRYMIKYTKRRVGLKAILKDETNSHYEDSVVKSKARALGVGLPLICSGESRSLSNASFKSSTVCARVLSQDPS